MERIPTETELNCLLGRDLESITFCQYQVGFNFDCDTPFLILTVESRLIHIHDGLAESPQRDDDLRIVGSSGLMRLLGFKITAIKIEDDGGLLLMFSNGDKIQVIPCSVYESYHITNGKTELHF
jgi:hypothetical protein